MRYTDFTRMLAESEIPSTYYSWPEDDSQHPAPDPPYLVWYLPETNNFAADDKVYNVILTLNVELYTDYKDFETELGLEQIFDAWGLVWDKTESYLDDEHMFEVLYTMEVLIDG